jgi:hypothetical protein
MPKFNVEFYKPEILERDGPSFSQVLDRIVAMNAVDRIRRADDPAAILGLRKEDADFLGEAARIRMEDLPGVIDIANGDRRELDVDAHEGLSEEIHFLYDGALDVIAIQSKGHFRAPALERLLADLARTSLYFQVILTEDAWERFQRMDFVTKVYFKLARPRDLRGQPQPSLRRVFAEIDEFEGVTAKMEITVGRTRGRLNMGAIRRLVNTFRGAQQGFKSLSLTGAIREQGHPDARSHPETIDFLKERLLYTQDVERGGRGRRLDAEGCRVALRRAIREHREHLRRHR